MTPVAAFEFELSDRLRDAIIDAPTHGLSEEEAQERKIAVVGDFLQDLREEQGNDDD